MFASELHTYDDGGMFHGELTKWIQILTAQGYYISLISHLVIDHWMCFFRISLKMGEAQRIGEFTQQTVAEIELPLWVMVLTIQQWTLLKQANWLFASS